MSPGFATREQLRVQAFQHIWREELDDIFEDVAIYYDRANMFASFGQWNRWRNRMLTLADPMPGERVLDVCAGTNAIGIGLLEKEPELEIQAIDRSEAMQRVGRERARERGFDIESTIGDVHELPFPDEHFDIVTLQWASRHLRVVDVLSEVRRVLRPGGRFCHCDMLRPGNKMVERLYYSTLWGVLSVAGLLFRSGPAALGSRDYFIDIIDMFYSSQEFSQLLQELGFVDVRAENVWGGIVAFHRAFKPAHRE
jgi:demethylmenaquinone methyltransferase/2-methoxy-6-polyprenyl-1,4-benzoquinol methylase